MSLPVSQHAMTQGLIDWLRGDMHGSAVAMRGGREEQQAVRHGWRLST